jgi:hypothetical protein
LKDVRPLGIGRLTGCVNSTAGHPGILIGTSKGLFHYTDPQGSPRRIRKHPIAYAISGESGVVCYEEIRGQGRLVILDSDLEELKSDTALARTINPVAVWESKLVVFHRSGFELLDPKSGDKREIAAFVPLHTMTPLVQAGESYEFIAAEREPSWPTSLYSLTMPSRDGEKGEVEVLAKAEDPLMSRVLLKPSEGFYVVVPQGVPVFLILKVATGKEPVLRSWRLVPIQGEVQPVGLVLSGKEFYAGSGDCLCRFELSDELMEGR